MWIAYETIFFKEFWQEKCLKCSIHTEAIMLALAARYRPIFHPRLAQSRLQGHGLYYTLLWEKERLSCWQHHIGQAWGGSVVSCCYDERQSYLRKKSFRRPRIPPGHPAPEALDSPQPQPEAERSESMCAQQRFCLLLFISSKTQPMKWGRLHSGWVFFRPQLTQLKKSLPAGPGVTIIWTFPHWVSPFSAEPGCLSITTPP